MFSVRSYYFHRFFFRGSIVSVITFSTEKIYANQTEYRTAWTWCKAGFMLRFFAFVLYRCQLFGHGPYFHFQLGQNVGPLSRLRHCAEAPFDCLLIRRPPKVIQRTTNIYTDSLIMFSCGCLLSGWLKLVKHSFTYFGSKEHALLSAEAISWSQPTPQIEMLGNFLSHTSALDNSRYNWQIESCFNRSAAKRFCRNQFTWLCWFRD